MKRARQATLIASTIGFSWLGMQIIHEFGHVLGAWLTGAAVVKVVLSPFALSRTDVAGNTHPQVVVWAGPVLGALLPLLLWGVAVLLRVPGTFMLRFFAGFCLVANGAYIAGGSLGPSGDCEELLRHGSPLWQLWLFGLVTVPAGLGLWHGQGPCFGLGTAEGGVNPCAAYASLLLLVLVVVLELALSPHS